MPDRGPVEYRDHVTRELDQIRDDMRFLRESIGALHKKFDDAVQVRITALEIDLAKIKSDMGPIYKLFWAIISAAIVGLGTFIWTSIQHGGPR